LIAQKACPFASSEPAFSGLGPRSAAASAPCGLIPNSRYIRNSYIIADYADYGLLRKLDYADKSFFINVFFSERGFLRNPFNQRNQR